MFPYIFEVGVKTPFKFASVSSFITKRFVSNAVRQTVKPVDSRKTFLIDSYKEIMEKHPVLLFCHHNNLMKNETAYFRSEISKAGGKLTVLRNNLFQVYLRNAHREDPAAPSPRKEQNWKHPLLPLFKGPTAAICFPDTDPSKVSKVLKLLEKAQDKLFVVGAKVESESYDVEQLNSFKNLPTKSQLQGELLGLLHVLSGTGLVQTLEAGSNVLYMTLKAHEENIDPSKKDSE